MTGATRQSVAILAAYTMMLVLVCPSIPTPIYTNKDQGVSHDKTMVMVPVIALRTFVWPHSRLEALPRAGAASRIRSVLELTSQRLC